MKKQLNEAGPVLDLFLVFQFLKRLVQPFDKMDAFKQGIIDADGKRTNKSIITKSEKDSYRMFDRLVVNLKRLLGKLPLGKTRLASYAAALLLIREHNNPTFRSQDLTEENISQALSNTLQELNSNPTLVNMLAEEIANAAGPGNVAGIAPGEDPPVGKRRKKKKVLKRTFKDFNIQVDEIITESVNGDCFQAGGRIVMKSDEADNMSLVHAFVYGQGDLEGRRFLHCWVEKGNTVIDKSNGNNITMPKIAYYALGDVREKEKGALVRYTKLETLLHMGKSHHWGPWDDGPDESLNEGRKDAIPDRKKEIGKKKVRIPKRILAGLNLSEATEKPLTKSELNDVEKFADLAFVKMKIDVEFSNHFLDRVNDARNKKQITASELKDLFGKTAKKHAGKIRQLGDDAEAVITSLNTDVNSPFVLELDREKGWIDMTMKTVMRKKNFKTPDRKFTVERVDFPKKSATLGVSRSKMPQVASKDYPALFMYLEKNNVKLSNKMMKASDLKPIQGEFSVPGIIKSINKSLLTDKLKPLIMSSDGFIIDGHHRWLSVINTKPKTKIPVIKASIKVRPLLALVSKFPLTTFKSIYEE